MNGITGWSYRPYTRLSERAPRPPYICALAPGESTLCLAWLDGGNQEHTVYYRPMKSYIAPEARAVPAGESSAALGGLTPYMDYEVWVERGGKTPSQSAVRYARTGPVPGTVVNYLHPEDEIYAFSGRSLCSPSLLKLPSGRLLASMDVFASGAPQNLTLIFASDDGGRSWDYLTDLFPCFWGKLFLHRGEVYMLANTTEYGDLVIGKSSDGGQSFCAPARLFPGAASSLDAGPHKAPMPIVSHGGRLATAVDYGAWKLGGHMSCLLSVNEDADLMCPGNWTLSEPVPYDPAWPGTVCGPCRGLLEGSAVVSPAGELMVFYRYQITDCVPNHGKAVLLRAAAGDMEAPLSFARVVDFNGANSKFDVLRDPATGKYLAVASRVASPATPNQRNVLALNVSDDLISWRCAKILLDYSAMPPGEVGFQYVSMLLDGEDLLYLSRTSLNRARNFHDANYQTFHRLENFRRYLAADREEEACI